MSEKYPKPHLGQTFFRYPNQDKTQREFAMCDGLVESGEVRGELQWSATLRDGRGGTEQITNRSVLGSGSWRPLPPEELETRYGPGYRVLEERIEKYAAAAQQAATLLDDCDFVIDSGFMIGAGNLANFDLVQTALNRGKTVFSLRPEHPGTPLAAGCVRCNTAVQLIEALDGFAAPSTLCRAQEA